MGFDPYKNDNLPFVIGEIGINHNGDVEIAKQLIDMAVDCGADAVKFQKRTIDIVYDKETLDGPRESPWGTTQREQKEGLEFGKEEYDQIDAYCKEKNILWFASAWDVESQKFLQQYDCKLNKIASAMLTHKDLLEEVAKEGKHTFISTGMVTFEQIDRAVEIFKKHSCPYSIMHCVSLYPCPVENCNISVIETLKKRYGCEIGYSGHEHGVLPSVLAVAAGAKSVERHITLDRTMYGSDQAASLEKKGFELMIRDARDVKIIMGDGNKVILSDEEKIAHKLRYFKENDFSWE